MDPVQQHPPLVVVPTQSQFLLRIGPHRFFHLPEPAVGGSVHRTVQRRFVTSPRELVLALGHALGGHFGFLRAFILHEVAFAAQGDPRILLNSMLDSPGVGPLYLSQENHSFLQSWMGLQVKIFLGW